MSGAPLVIPTELTPYNSYQEDPKWQLKFTYIWTSAVGSAILLSLPTLLLAYKNRSAFTGFWGIREEWITYTPVEIDTGTVESGIRRTMVPKVRAILRGLASFAYWALPGIELNTGQVSLVLAYLVVVLVCVILNAPLMSNPNRAGFLAIAQLPPTFLFATKNSVLSLLLGPGHGYEKLNYLHRWCARGLFLGALVHGSLWIRNHLQYNIPIIGAQKETSGIATFGILCAIVLTSWRAVRRMSWQFFWAVHVLGFPAFFITLCYHTIYAAPWIFPPLAFYGLDLLLRMLKYRVKDATLIAIDQQMTIITIPDCTSGWIAGQHVRLRVFFDGHIFESHPLTIMSAPSSVSCLHSEEGQGAGIILGARVRGDWTRALNSFVRKEQDLQAMMTQKSEIVIPSNVPVQVLLDGPYGGCSVDLGNYETVLLFAGGSGATFTVGLLDDIIGRCARGRHGSEITKRIEFSWCIRSFGALNWFASYLMQIAKTAAQCESIDLHISVYVTCLCNPEDVPPIPNSDVTIVRPTVHKVLQSLMTPPCARAPLAPATVALDGGVEEAVARNISEKLPWVGVGGGVAVCAAGPETMTREAFNAVARMQLLNSIRNGELGDIELHTELFSV